MTVLLSRDWTGDDGDSWEDVGFRRIRGAALSATILSNQGRCGAVAGERFLALTGWPQLTGHKLAGDLVWGAAGSQSRAPGLGVHWTQDGANGYLGEIDSNTGNARVRLRRLRGGSWTDLTGWIAVHGAPYSISAAMLDAGVTCELRVENVDGGVSLRLKVAGVVVAQHTDTDADRLEDAGLAGFWLDALSSTGDVTYDDAFVRDFADERAGDPADLDEGIALEVDGVPYSYDELEEAGVDVGRGGTSYAGGDAWTFSTAELMDAADGILYPGAWVRVRVKGEVVAAGRIQVGSRRLAPGEGRTFTLVPPAELAADVPLEHPDTHAPTLIYNLEPDHSEYDASRANKTAGQQIAEVLTICADGPTGLRAHGAAPADENTPVFVQAELDAITGKVRGVALSRDPWQAVNQALAPTKYLVKIDPGTLQWRFHDRTAGTIQQVEIADDDAEPHVVGEYTEDTSRNCSAVLARGERPQLETVQLAFDPTTPGLGLGKGWPAALESTTSASKRVRNRAEFLVASISGSVGAPTVTPNPTGPPAFSMEALEWVKGTVGFLDGAEAGETYDVTTNTSGALTLVGPWRNGGPSPGDQAVVSGNAVGGGRDNAHTEIGRRFELEDVDQGIPDDVCLRVTIIKDGIKKVTTARVETPADPAEKAQVVLDLPAVGLVNHTPEEHTSPCEAGGASDLARVEVEIPTYSRSDPRVPRRWYPRDGAGEDAYRGECYATDPAKWDGAGQPGKGDRAVRRHYELDVPEFDGSTAQNDEIDAIAAELLEFLSPIGRNVRLEISGLDTRFADLGCRLQVIGGPAELETIETLHVRAVEYDLKPPRTIVHAGTLADGEFDIQAMRREVIERHLKRQVERKQGQLQKLLDCLGGNLHNAGYARQAAPSQICGNEVTTDVTKEGRSAKEDIQVTLDLIIEIWDWLSEQKGMEITVDPEGRLWVNDDGQWKYSDDGENWFDQAANDGPENKGGSGADPGDAAGDDPKPSHPDQLGSGGGNDGGTVERTIWNAVLGILANLGKTIDLTTGQVLAPGTINNPTNNPEGHPWVTLSPDDGDPDKDPERTPVGSGDPVPPTSEPPKAPVLGNLMKTEDPNQLVAPPNLTLPDGGTFFAPGGQVSIPAGGKAPPSTLSLIEANKAAEGLAVESLADPIGAVLRMPGGELFVAKPSVSGYGDTRFREVEAASGGAGTGENDGDYEEVAVDPVTPLPRVHLEAQELDGSGVLDGTDGYGRSLPDGGTTTGTTEPLTLPGTAEGYDGRRGIKVAVTVRAEGASGDGDARLQVSARYVPPGADPTAVAYTTIVAAGPVALLADGSTAVVEGTLDVNNPGTSNGGYVQVRVTRDGAHASDTLPGRVNVLGVGVDAACTSIFVAAEDHA